MEIIEDAQFRAELLKKIREREFSERTGIHMSDLNYCLNKQALRKFKPKEDTDQETLIFSIGWATQRWLTGAEEDEPEKIVDGITVTCDALMRVHRNPTEREVEDTRPWGVSEIYEDRPWELKATYQSSNRPIEENIHWIRQIMCQCYVQGTTEAYLTRFELMGNWKMRPLKGATAEEKKNFVFKRPTLHAYKLSFTREELEKNWQWFRDRKELFEGVLASKALLVRALALPPGGAWECGYCSYVKECEEGSKANDKT